MPTAVLKAKLHRLEIEYAILKDLDHVRYIYSVLLTDADFHEPNIITVRQVFITTYHM